MSNSRANNKAKACDLCTAAFKTGEEVLHCEGSCKKPLHRYCAGISKHHYQKIIDEPVPFVCLPCTQLLHEAELRTHQSEIELLKTECRELQPSYEPRLLGTLHKLPLLVQAKASNPLPTSMH